MVFNEETILRLRSKANSLPLTPGVYLMKDKGGRIIYVGKSKSMKNRVSSYFTDVKNHTIKTATMVSLVQDFDYMLTSSNIEALALENRLIKLHQPKFNIRLKDGKSYPYLRFTLNSEYPDLTFTRKRLDDKASYFGPYSGAQIALSLMKSAQKTFGIASCNKKFPRDIGKERACIYKQIGQCLAPCDGSVGAQEYKEQCKKAAAFLRGSLSDVKKDLEEKMERAAQELNFEAAAQYRDKIKILEACRQNQNVVGAPDDERDVIALYSDDTCSVLSVFYIREGCVVDSENIVFPAEQIAEEEDVCAFLCDFYNKREFIPAEILFDFEISTEGVQDLSEYLEMLSRRRVRIRFPEKGSIKKLCRMVYENAVEAARHHTESMVKQNSIAIKLAQLLSLEVVPQVIEAYDISNIGSENITAGKICIEDGKFLKSGYRTYKIKGTDMQDDYASMQEALRRRLMHTEDKYPDLILLDGGKGHVSSVKEVLDDMGISIPVFGMVKDEYHKTRALTDEHNEISIARENAVFVFIYKIQEEVHRYTIGRMHNAKRKSVKTSSLTQINGIGAVKAKNIMAHFKSLSAVRNAAKDEIEMVKGLNSRDAESIYLYFHSEESKDNKEEV